ncbi:MAG: acylhydrolase [Chitinophagaceae bacterium]|jgi:lysophospholipase L1-like esterase|nr:acylhydrolase [Chitinophagaceae bacterium]
MTGKYIVIAVMLLACTQGKKVQTAERAEWANMKKYRASNDSVINAGLNDSLVVFMGNSITESWENFDPHFFKSKPYVNRGISGQTTAQMLARFRQDVVELKPKLVVILAGTNDIAENGGPVTLKKIFDNIQSMAKLARANDIKVILCSVLPAIKYKWRPQIEPADKIIWLNKMISDYCAKKNITYVDFHTSLADAQKGLDKRFSNDGVHPTLAGYKVMEPIIQEAIEKSLYPSIR